jgi:hypothetical protein
LLKVLPSADPVGDWPVVEPAVGGDEPLDDLLSRCGAAPLGARHAVLAVGSNASPTQMHRKFTTAGLRPVVPFTAVTVRGIIAGVSAHVNRAGYVPATPVLDSDTVSDLFLTWLDDEQLAAMDLTEPNYRRVRIPAGYPVSLPGGQAVAGCWFYVSRHGCLLGRDGLPRRLLDQTTLITSLLNDVPELAALAGPSPNNWIARTRTPDVRDRIRGVLHAAGMVRQQPELRAAP